MKLQQIIIHPEKEIQTLFSSAGFETDKATLILAFGERIFLETVLPYKKIAEIYPNAHIVICSTSGQISNTSLVENSGIATAIQFEKTTIRVSEIDIIQNKDIPQLGSTIKKDLLHKDLKSILVLSEGSFINGTELINELILQTKDESLETLRKF